MNSQQMYSVLSSAESGYTWLMILISGAIFGTVYVHRKVAPIPLSIKVPHIALPNITLILCLAFLVRLPALAQPLWYDETFTARMASIPLQNLPAAIMGDVHPPLNYLIQWLTARLLGDSAIALRLPSLAFGLLCVYIVYRLTECYFPHTSRWAALIVALLPMPMYYSAEARQYALLAALALGVWLAIAERRKLLFMVCAGLLMWTHNLAAVYLLLACFWALWVARPRKAWMLPVAAACLLNALWLPFMLIQARDVADGFWLSNTGIFWVITQTTVSYADNRLAIILYIGAIAFTVGVALHWRELLRYRPGLLLLVIGTPLLLAFISVVWRPVFLARAMLPVGMGLAILWAYLVVRHRWLQIPMLAMLVLGVVGFWLHPRGMAWDVLQKCDQADSILYLDTATAFIGSYYAPRSIEGYLWTGANDLNQSLSEEAKNAFQFAQIDIKRLGGYVCVVAADTPLISTLERGYLRHVLSSYPYIRHVAVQSPIYALGVYIVEVGPHE